MAFIPPEDEGFEIMMTPMIDCVFLLLIYFLCATSFYKIEKDITITLPDASESSVATSGAKEIVVNVRKNGVVVVRQRVLGLGDLEKMLQEAKKADPNPTVIVRGDQEALHVDVVKVMNTCLKAKITNISVATFKPQGQTPK
jgi:biopolymer transport protein ExbD